MGVINQNLLVFFADVVIYEIEMVFPLIVCN